MRYAKSGPARKPSSLHRFNPPAPRQHSLSDIFARLSIRCRIVLGLGPTVWFLSGSSSLFRPLSRTPTLELEASWASSDLVLLRGKRQKYSVLDLVTLLVLGTVVNRQSAAQASPLILAHSNPDQISPILLETLRTLMHVRPSALLPTPFRNTWPPLLLTQACGPCKRGNVLLNHDNQDAVPRLRNPWMYCFSVRLIGTILAEGLLLCRGQLPESAWAPPVRLMLLSIGVSCSLTRISPPVALQRL